jgi:hypothetical protein
VLTVSVASLIKPDVVKALPGGGEEPKVTVKNDLGNISFQCIVEEPATLDELVQVIVNAKQKNLSVKPVGSLHSFS